MTLNFQLWGIEAHITFEQTADKNLSQGLFVDCFYSWSCFSFKLKRKKAQQTAKRVKLQALDQAHFAKETVSSILKKAPPGEEQVKSKSPSRAPAKEGPWIPERDVVYVSPQMQKKQYQQQVNE